MERKWTPGPWRWQAEDECLVGPHQIVMRQDEDGRKTFAYYGDGTEQANARLIAASPELYEALEDLWTWVKNWDAEFMEDDEFDRSIYDAALAKARGETE